ncbi:hypothetical protein [Rosenbergiella australiborealis]|uniref:hypothetical protein n=1 Tax=Rosenbergiella australiborealis TaxID=1544696 RepID=UPI001F4EDC3A|nr:hypothetical protein [Rosenbergiella australiborealis]
MNLRISGVTEEEYGLWRNNGVSKHISYTENNESIFTKIGFQLEDIKSFELDLNHTNHIIFVKIHNNKTYDLYREHLITLIKMMIINKKEYDVHIYIVSDKNQDYKNELTNFFNLNTHYEKKQTYGENMAIIKCLSMRFLGFTITNLFLKISSCSTYFLKKESK